MFWIHPFEYQSPFSQSLIFSLVFLMFIYEEGDLTPCLKSWVYISVAEVFS